MPVFTCICAKCISRVISYAFSDIKDECHPQIVLCVAGLQDVLMCDRGMDFLIRQPPMSPGGGATCRWVNQVACASGTCVTQGATLLAVLVPMNAAHSTVHSCVRSVSLQGTGKPDCALVLCGVFLQVEDQSTRRGDTAGIKVLCSSVQPNVIPLCCCVGFMGHPSFDCRCDCAWMKM